MKVFISYFMGGKHIKNRQRTQYIEDFFGDTRTKYRSVYESCDEKLQHMQLGASEARLIAMLLQMIGAKMVLELGTLVGYSTIWIADNIKQHGGKVVSVDKSEKHCEIARENVMDFGLGDIITIVNDEAINALQHYAITMQGQFDAVFIDAKKSEYIDYLPLVKQCLRRGGVIIADNIFLWGEIERYHDITNISDKNLAEMVKNMHAFNLAIATDPELNSAVIPTVEGMVVAMKK